MEPLGYFCRQLVVEGDSVLPHTLERTLPEREESAATMLAVSESAAARLYRAASAAGGSFTCLLLLEKVLYQCIFSVGFCLSVDSGTAQLSKDLRYVTEALAFAAKQNFLNSCINFSFLLVK